VIEHKFGKLNEGADALSQRLFQLDTWVLGFENLKSLYASNEDFGELYANCLRHPKHDFVVQDVHLFKSTRLYMPKSSTQELLIREEHSGSLAGHYGENKMLSIL